MQVGVVVGRGYYTGEDVNLWGASGHCHGKAARFALAPPKRLFAPVPRLLHCDRCGKPRSLFNPGHRDAGPGKEVEIIVFSGKAHWCEVLEKQVWKSDRALVWFHTRCWREHCQVIDLE